MLAGDCLLSKRMSNDSCPLNCQIIRADYANPRHQRDIPWLLNEYASDSAGGGQPLPESTLEMLVASLAALPQALSFLAYVDEQPAGLANCFMGFSTFACQPLVNIHDLCVRQAFRGRGVGQGLLAAIEREARARGCCKITLEVLSRNEVALASYRRFGFSVYQLSPEMGEAQFWQKMLG